MKKSPDSGELPEQLSESPDPSKPSPREKADASSSSRTLTPSEYDSLMQEVKEFYRTAKDFFVHLRPKEKV